MKNPAAVALGSIKSAKKAATSAANGRRSAEEGKKGGRPKKLKPCPSKSCMALNIHNLATAKACGLCGGPV